jgi:hypothetical protein
MPDAHYPINFVVKHPNLLVLQKKARPEAVRNLPDQSRKTGGLSPNRRRSLQTAAIGKQ